jgi:hypothetical protein
MKMLTLYLDNNVYHHMQRSYGDAVELKQLLERETRPKGIRTILSLANLCEFIPLGSKDGDEFKKKIQLLRSIVDWDLPLKPLRQLLTDDVRWFARYGKGTSPFSGPGSTIRKLMRHALRILASPSVKDVHELREIADGLMKEKGDFELVMDQGRRPVLKIVRSSNMCFPDLAAMWEHCFQNEDIVERLLQPHAEVAGKLKQCRKRGLPNMMNIPSIRMAVGYDLSFIYWMAFRKREASKRDAGDRRHAIYSSAADVFVCADDFLRKL